MDRLVKSGDIYLDKYSGWYSISDEAYYDEDEIEEKDNEKNFLNHLDLVVDWVEEESFLNYQNGQETFRFYKKNKDFILPLSRKNEVIKFCKKGLKDLSVSRTSFSWGIPVPKNNKHVIYVWLDALTNYISALIFLTLKDKNYKNFWPADVHVIGKDILRFHAVYWPAFFLAANIPFATKKDFWSWMDFI